MKNNNVMKLFTIFLVVLIITGCSYSKKENISSHQIKTMADIATLKVVYHEVATKDIPKGNEIQNIGEIDRKLWIEYNGVIEIGFNGDEIETEQDGNNITFQVPKAKIVKFSIEGYDKKSCYKSEDSWINKNKIDYNDYNKALSTSKKDIKDKAIKDKELISEAQDNLEQIIKKYMNELGKRTGKQYNIVFNFKN